MLAKLTAYRVQPSIKQKPGHDFGFVCFNSTDIRTLKVYQDTISKINKN